MKIASPLVMLPPLSNACWLAIYYQALLAHAAFAVIGEDQKKMADKDEATLALFKALLAQSSR
jgi:hypothetical protein